MPAGRLAAHSSPRLPTRVAGRSRGPGYANEGALPYYRLRYEPEANQVLFYTKDPMCDGLKRVPPGEGCSVSGPQVIVTVAKSASSGSETVASNLRRSKGAES